MATERSAQPGGEQSPEERLRVTKIFVESIIEAAYDPLLVLTSDLRVQSANPAFYQHWGVPPEETLGRRIYELGNGQWDIPALRTLLEDVLPDNTVFHDFEVQHEVQHMGTRVMLVSGRRVDHVQLILLGFRDITDQRRAENALREREERASYLLQLSDVLRPLGTPVEIQIVAARILGERLETDRVYYVEIDEPNDQFVVTHEWNQNGVPSHTRRYRLKDWPRLGQTDGKAWVVRDAADDRSMTEDHRDLFPGMDMSAAVVVPLIKDGRLVATFVAAQRRPREWTPGEVAIVEETADRTWAAVEQARAEEQFRQIAENVREAFWVFTPGFSQALYVSPTYEVLTGRSVEGIYRNARDFLDAVHSDDIPGLLAAMGRIGDEAAHAEFRLQHADGSERWFLVRGYPVRDEQGSVYRVVGSTEDITERKHAELELRASEQRLQQILDALPVGVVLADADGQLVWHNPAARRLWGGIRMVGLDRYGQYKGWWVETGQRIRAEEWALARALRGEEVPGEVVDIEGFDGVRRTTLTSAAPLRDDAGTLVGAIVVQEDITEARARDAKQRLLAAALSGLREGVCLLTPEGEFVYANEAFTRMLGIDPTQIPGLRMDAFALDAEAATQQVDNIRTALRHGRWTGRIRRKRLSDEVEVPIDIILGRLDDAGPGAGLLYAVAQDATETIQREQQLRRAERLASVGTLIGGVAHELNNPLHAIYNFSELMLMEERNENDRESLEIIRRESERMAKIVSALKEIARNTQEEVQPRVAVDLNEVVRHVLKVQDYRLRTSNIEVREDLAGDLPKVLGDRGALEQVILNLVTNAEQAMASHADKGRLILRTRASAGGAALHVVDDGPGIPAPQMERIFDPFYTTKSKGVGTGLGLSLVHSIIAEHGGDIRVDSQVGAGAAFRIELPRAPERLSGLAPDQTMNPTTRSLRILIVDDEASVRSVTVRSLERRGHRVDEAAEGGAALEMLDGASYDVILSDLRMPGLGGEAMLEHLRELGLSDRVIFMTGDPGGAGSRLQGAGIPVLRKPIRLQELADNVERIARRED